MAAVEVTISGVLYDKYNRTTQQVVLVGEGSLTGLGVGGGPMPPGQGCGGLPPGFYPGDPPDRPRPTPPIAGWPSVPGFTPGGPGGPGIPGGPGGGQPPLGHWGGDAPWPGYATPPIFIPPNVPPIITPPTPPNPGDPTTPLPPPEGSGGWPVQPIAVPPYIVVMYPGVGPVVVAPPAPAG
jgi:hypothetical protein